MVESGCNSHYLWEMGNLGNLILGEFRKSEYILMKRRSGQEVLLRVVRGISLGIRQQHIRMKKLKITENF